jgi:hypothetical protein
MFFTFAQVTAGPVVSTLKVSKLEAVALGFPDKSENAPVQTLMVIGVDELEVTLKVY